MGCVLHNTMQNFDRTSKAAIRKDMELWQLRMNSE